MITGLAEAAGCTVGDMLRFAEINNLIITPVAEFNKTVIVVFVIGAIIGVCAWELFKYMYHYGKQQATKKL
jgi:hypothetical protein